MKKIDYYVVFLIGSDNFEISEEIRKNEKGYGMDEIFDYCVKVAQLFQKSKHIENLSLSTYTALEKFLGENFVCLKNMLDNGDF